MTETLLFALNHLWQSTLIAGVAWLICATLLTAHSPAVRFNVWMAACVKFLVPFSVLVGLGKQLSVRPALTLPQSQQVLDLVTYQARAMAMSPFASVRPAVPAASTSHPVLFWAVVIWALGGMVVASQWMTSWWRIRRAAKAAVPRGRFHGIPLMESPALRAASIEPGVYGLWSPVILIPEGMDRALSAAQLNTVLAHEREHAQRRDNFWALLQMLTEIMFWFYPVVWIVGRKLNEERELSCDEAVLRNANPGDAENYAEGILEICKLYVASPVPCVAGITGANLRARIDTILRNERPLSLGQVRRWLLGATLFVAVSAPAIIGFLTAPALFAQQANSFVGMATSAEKKFEVATVKPNTSGENRFQLGPPGQGNISITNVALHRIIIQSFRAQPDTVIGVPDWADDKYDIVGKGPDSKLTNPQVWEMMRSLLIERFHMKFHVENREMPVYALTIAPRGLKLTLGENGRCKQEVQEGKPCGDIIVPPFGTAMYNMPIGALITGLGARAGRPIVDKTGLTGRYDANVRWLPDGVKLEDVSLNDIPAEYRPEDMTVFQALEAQAGLKLVPERAPMPVVFIDGLSRPDPN